MMEDNDTGNYVYVDDDGNTTKIYFRNGEVEKIIYNEKRLSKDSDEYLQRLRDLKRNEEKTRREFEREREKYNRELERYREDLERKREKISRKKYEEALRKVEESERRAEESVRRVEESVRRENERLKQKGQDKLFNEMRKDGLLNERRNKITARNGNITINGNTLSGSQLQKYKELFKKYLEMDVDAKGNSYSWTWEDEDN
jgi:F0F1-type ATP synthase membrane subunit b/b'